MDADEMVLQDRETKQWLDDIESFRHPPPVKRLTDDQHQQQQQQATGNGVHVVQDRARLVSNGQEEDFVSKLRKFQLSDSHPYSDHEKVEAYKKLASAGRLPGPGMLSLAVSAKKKEVITKQQATALRDEVTRVSRPVNKYSSPRSDSDSGDQTWVASDDRVTNGTQCYANRSSNGQLAAGHCRRIRSGPAVSQPTMDGYHTAMADREVSRIMGSPPDAVFHGGLPSKHPSQGKYAHHHQSPLRYAQDGLEDGLHPARLTSRSSSSQHTPLYGKEALLHQQRKYKAIERLVEEEIARNNTVYGNCARCSGEVSRLTDGVHALGALYHPDCFVCCCCDRPLGNKKFYEFNGRAYCEQDYMYCGYQEFAEKCHACGGMILDMILQAGGKCFHPQCFCCHQCGVCLDGVPFTVDNGGRFYCLPDYHRLFAPNCAKCHTPITPVTGAEETVRVVAMERDYHVDCYVCEGCGMQLTDEPDKRCYPLGDHLLCKSCYVCWTRTGGTANPITDV